MKPLVTEAWQLRQSLTRADALYGGDAGVTDEHEVVLEDRQLSHRVSHGDWWR